MSEETKRVEQDEQEAFKEFHASLARLSANASVSMRDRVMILSNATFLMDEYARVASLPAAPADDARRMRTLCRLLDAMDDMGNDFPGEVHAAFQEGGKVVRETLDKFASAADAAAADEGRRCDGSGSLPVSTDDWKECPSCNGAGCKPVSHTWDEDGERCLKCGDKDWMADESCSERLVTAAPSTAAQGATLTDEQRKSVWWAVLEAEKEGPAAGTLMHRRAQDLRALLAAPTPVADSGASVVPADLLPNALWTRRGSGTCEWWSFKGYEARKDGADQWVLRKGGKELYRHTYLQVVMAHAEREILAAAKPVSVDAGGVTDDPAPVEHALLHWSMGELRAGRNTTAETNRGFRAGWQAARETPPTESTGEPK